MKATTKFIEEFRNKWEGANATTNTISTLMMDRMEEDLKDILTKHEEAVVDYIVDKMQIEVSEYKLTPFEQTVNTYIKNRGEEIKKEALQAIE